MGKVVGVKFKPSGKSYDFDSGAFVLNQGDHVIVETEQGLGFGMVARAPRTVADEAVKKPLKKIFRLATEADFSQARRMQDLEKEAFDYCEKSIKKLGLAMNLFVADSTFDGSKLTFFFTADGRVDFRELVKTLVRHFRTRIELRQIGVRHQAKMCGGMGRCGRETCCTSFMNSFVPVSVKMAKAQNLSLNPTKISGLCGRLMCCLTFEHENYQKMAKELPKLGRIVQTPAGPGKTFRHNILKGKVMVRLEGGKEEEFSVEELNQARREPASPPPENNSGARPEKKDRAHPEKKSGSQPQKKTQARQEKKSGPSKRKHRSRRGGRKRGGRPQEKKPQ